MILTAVGFYPRTPNRPRPARLRRAIAHHDRGEISAEDLHRVEDEITREVIDEQVKAGLDLVTDGLVRWEDPLTYVARRLRGVEVGGLLRYFDTNTYFRQPSVTAEIAWTGPITVRDFEFARQHSPKPVKPVLPGPFTLAKLSRDTHYRHLERLAMGYARALHQEAKALEAAGASIVQFDEPAICRAKDEIGIFERVEHKLVEGLKVKTALYTYFGDVDGIEHEVFRSPFRVIGLDFVMGRGNMAALKRGHFDKELGFGVVDARNTRLESPEETAGRVHEIASLVPSHRLYVNPSCGLEFLPREEAFEKLKRMAEGARLALEGSKRSRS